MKRLVVLLVGLVICFQTIKAQKYSFGIFADPQISWFTSDTKKYDPNGAVSGFNLGFSSERFFAQRYSILSGLSITTVGGNIRFTQLAYSLKTIDSSYTIGVGGSVKYKSQYLTLPVGFKFRTNQIGYTTYFANVGVSGSLRIRSRVWNGENGVDRETTNTDVAWGFASYFIGVGGEYSLGGESALQFGIIWSDGLTPILEYPKSTITSQSLSLKIGVIF